MHNLKAISRWAEHVLISLDIPYCPPAELRINTRARTRYGQCRKTPEGFSINISEVLLKNSSDLRALQTTLLHELLHTCPGCMNHGPLWQYYADKVNAATGLHISTTVDFSREYGLPDLRKEKTPVYRYLLYCPHCDQQWPYQKRSKAITYPALYACPDCNTPLRSRPLSADESVHYSTQSTEK